ncbi:MAG: hypothetical protein ABSB91_04185 [Sedimentisphaerales bacterium]
MARKIWLLTVSAVSLLFCFLTPAIALDTKGIEAARSKKVLDNADLQTIDSFVAQGAGEITNATDFSSISNTRSLIIANSASNEPGQVQFAQQFSDSAKKYIAADLEKADGLNPPERRFRVTINLLMLVDGLADPHLAEIPLKYIDYNKPAVSYWAVHCLASPEVVAKLNSVKDSEVTRQISRRLETIVPTACPETLGLITSFAGKAPDGFDLLLKVADKRIASYANWSVENELLDASVLQQLCDKIVSSDPGKAEAARRFCQLYSYVFQRYLKGDDLLSDTQKTQLISVLVETEKSCLPKLTGKPSISIKRAIETSDNKALQQEYIDLLGEGTRAGQLLTDLNFDFGKAPDGSLIKSPQVLPKPPEN